MTPRSRRMRCDVMVGSGHWRDKIDLKKIRKMEKAQRKSARKGRA